MIEGLILFTINVVIAESANEDVTSSQIRLLKHDAF